MGNSPVYQIRPAGEGELTKVVANSEWAFSFGVSPSGRTAAQAMLPQDASFLVEENGQIAGAYASHSYQLRTPGPNQVSSAGLTWVGVHPQHRGHGLLRRMIQHHLTDCRSRGLSVSTLYAAEPEIYGRFGYSGAVLHAHGHLSNLAKLTTPIDPNIRAQFATADIVAHAEIISRVLKRNVRPGSPVVASPEMLCDVFNDPVEDRAGFEPLRIVWMEDNTGPVAYALFRRSASWKQGLSQKKGEVTSWCSANAAATSALVHTLIATNLTDSLFLPTIPVDSELFLSLENLRSFRSYFSDGIWLRIVDVPTALRSRNYSADGTWHLHLKDDLIAENEGLWRLTVTHGQMEVTRLTSTEQIGTAPVLTIPISKLADIFLGARTLSQLHRAGLTDCSEADFAKGDFGRLSASFSSALAPVGCIDF